MSQSSAPTDTTTGTDASNKESESTTPMHYFLACIELTFMDSDKETGVTRVNTMMMSADGPVNVRLLGLAQQGAQIQLRKKLNEDVNILNATFLNISYLGQMLPEEFHAGQPGQPHPEQFNPASVN